MSGVNLKGEGLSFWTPANALTLFRIVAAAAIVPLLKIPSRAAAVAALVVFLAASLSDVLDGWLARLRHEVTPWGQLMDPFADKILVFSVLACFVGTGEVPVWAFAIMLAREFLVTSTRMFLAANGSIRPARSSGKHKTVAQMLLLWALLVHHFWRHHPTLAPESDENFKFFLSGLVWVVIFMTVWSGYRFLVDQIPQIRSLVAADPATKD